MVIEFRNRHQKEINKPAIISSAMSRRSLANKETVGDDGVGDHVTCYKYAFYVLALREVSDATKQIVNDQIDSRLRKQCSELKFQIHNVEVLGFEPLPIPVKIGRYVTKASLRHITANDEVSSLSGDFIIAHHSPANVKRSPAIVKRLES